MTESRDSPKEAEMKEEEKEDDVVRIKISRGLRNKLRTLGIMGETYDIIIDRLLPGETSERGGK